MAAAEPRRKGPWSALQQPLFRALWVTNVASGIGSTMHDTAAVWTMTSLTTSPALVTLMAAMSSLPLFLLALPAGALADVLDRRRVLLAAQLGALGITLGLTALAYAGRLSPAVLLGATALLGVAGAFTAPSWQALMAEIVGKEDLAGAMTLGSVGVNIARALGPIAGGVVVAAAGPGTVFAVNGVSFVGILWVLWRAKAPASGVARRERLLGAMVAAVRFTRHSPVVQAVLVRTAVVGLCGVAPMALLPVLVKREGLAAADFGLWMGGYGVGGIVAAFVLLPPLRARWGAHTIVRGAMTVFALCVALLSVVSGRWVVAPVLFVGGAAWLTTLSTLTVAGQSLYPNWVRARSSAIALLVLQGALATGALLWGAVASELDVRVALALAAGGLVLGLLVDQLRPGPSWTAPDLSASDHWAEHAFADALREEEAPVVVTVDYCVAAADAKAFCAAAGRLRLVRLRDGAFRWSLLRSVEGPATYREVFYVGSWSEHQRQHQRATVADREIEEAVLRFHHAAEAPVVAHYLVQEAP